MMRSSILTWVAAGVAGLLGIIVLIFQPSLTLMVAALVAGIGAKMVIARPFLGVLTLVALLQQEAWTKFPIHIHKATSVTFADIMVLLVLIGIVVGRLRRPRVEPLLPEDRILRLGILFVAVAGVSFLYNHELFRKGLIETQKFAGFMVLVILLVYLTRSKRQVRALVLAMVISTTISSGALVLDRYAGAGLGRSSRALRFLRVGKDPGTPGRLTGSGGTAENSGKMMVVGTTVSAMMFLLMPTWRPLTGITTLLGLIALPATGTRMAMVVLVPAILWMIFIFRRHRRIAITFAALPVALMLILAIMPASTMRRLESLKNPTQDSTTPWRVSMYTIGLDLLKKNPLLGVGPGQFEHLFIDYDYRWEEGTTPQPMHSAYLGIAVDTGLVGFTLFLSLLIGAWLSLQWAQKHAEDAELRALAQAVSVAYAIYLLTAATGPGHRQLFLWSLIGTGLAIGKVARRAAAEARLAEGRAPAMALPPALRFSRTEVSS